MYGGVLFIQGQGLLSRAVCLVGHEIRGYLLYIVTVGFLSLPPTSYPSPS